MIRRFVNNSNLPYLHSTVVLTVGYIAGVFSASNLPLLQQWKVLGAYNARMLISQLYVSYTRVNAKLGFGKTSFMNTPDSVQYESGLKTWNHSTNALLWFYQVDVV